MPKGPGSTSDNYVFSSTHSHSRTHSVTTYSVADRLVGIGTLSYTELTFVTLTLFQTLRATRHTRCVRKVSNLRSYLCVGAILRHPDRGILYTVNSAFGITFAVGHSPLLKRTVRYAKYFRASRSHSLECRNSIFDRMWE